MMTTRYQAILSAAGGTVLAVLMAGPAGAGLPEPFGGQLAVACRPACRSPAPPRAESFADLVRVRQEHETLLRVYLDGSIVPTLLAKLPEQQFQGREWLLTLRPGLRDHRAESLTAAAVVASWQHLLDSKVASKHWWLLAAVEGAVEYHRGQAEHVRGLEVVNELQLRVRLRAAWPGFIQALAAVPLAPLASRALRASTSGRMAIAGSGPFLAGAIAAGGGFASSTFFAAHALGRPLLDELRWYPAAADRSARLDLALGKVQLVVGSWQAAEDWQTYSAEVFWPVWLVPNPKLREELPRDFWAVLAGLVAHSGLVDYLGADRTRPLFDLYGAADTAAPAAAPAPAGFARRLAREQAELPRVLTLLYRAGDEMERRVAEKLQVVLMKLGVTLALVGADAAHYRQHLVGGEYHLRLEQPLLLCQDESLRLLGALAWLEGQDERVAGMMAELLERMAQVPPGKERRVLVRKLEASFRKRLTVLPLVARRRQLLASSRIRALRWLLSGLPDLSEAWLESAHE